MEVATLDGTDHSRKSRNEPPLKVAGYDYAGSRKNVCPKPFRRNRIDRGKEGRVGGRFFIRKETKYEEERKTVLTNRVARDQLVVRRWASTERPVDRNERHGRRTPHHVGVSENDNIGFGCIEQNKTREFFTEYDI